jgi:beta-phosphoglucomutase-like phosphatase (HAD superfamily)
MQNWMRALAQHYEAARQKFRNDRLLLLFDIDGTILDMRYTVLHLLKTYDGQYGTAHFRNLQLADIDFHEDDIGDGLRALGVPTGEHRSILTWFCRHRWSNWALFEAHRPFPGVLEVIRWFQVQPGTRVGLNTGRPESMRAETLASLNRLGREFRVAFSNELLQMNRHGREKPVAEVKAEGVSKYRRAGFRVISVVDNEPENLLRVAEIDPDREILLLHASTLFRRQRGPVPDRAIDGKVYDLTQLIPRRSLPRHIQFVWSGAAMDGSLEERFLASNVRWADLGGAAARPEPETGNRVAGGFRELLARMKQEGRGARVTLGADRLATERLFRAIRDVGPDPRSLWFTAALPDLKSDGFRTLAASFPGSIIECSIDFLAPLVLSAPEQAEAILDTFSEWGINRFAFSWGLPDLKAVLDSIEECGFELTICGVAGLECFLQSVLLMPRAIVADFRFPQWEQEEREVAASAQQSA